MNFNNAVFEAAFGAAGQIPKSDLPEICIAGRSNVGKSSLINCLTGRKALARVSGKPGKTGTINFYRIDNFRLVDLPGYGYAKVSSGEKYRWGELMEDYFAGGRNIPLAIQLVDMRHPPSELDISMMQMMLDMGMKFAVVMTKSDKLNKTEYNQRLASIREELKFIGEDVEIIPFSSLKKEGLDALKKIMENSIC